MTVCPLPAVVPLSQLRATEIPFSCSKRFIADQNLLPVHPPLTPRPVSRLKIIHG